ncbi:FprA family A-type flavoprotein [Hippea maritima]|uniref:Beta-lactamase domain protein n=1 Tax=Hippea maritima (strain ATCC 700847 / DSM 10411 / MH2) TaxID=760142 RepID=F2LTY9_HIPMA|nr:FprA family A-type flavoprotein [Hippea maritima]AEA33388.1 beta-lactamase domain protein [Hippea maritima DSM 10411]
MIKRLKEGVYNVGAIDWDRTLFDEIVPTPQGTSYNAYLVIGKDKTALIDTVEPQKFDELRKNLEDLDVKKIDYLISNHTEQDHSGSIPMILDMYPEAQLITNEKCKGFEMDLLHIPGDKFTVIKEGDEIDLGGRTLRFIMTPWVHWPETMSTYLVEDKILFSCDFFGSHVATSYTFAKYYDKVYHEAKRYYAEIMMPFRNFIEKNIKKVEALDIDMIAPSHGPVFDDPGYIINAYKEWIDPKPSNMVLIAFVSMHESTRKMVEFLADELEKRGVDVKIRNLTTSDVGEIAMDLVDVATIIIATPTVLAGAHPNAVYGAYLANVLRPKAKFAGIIGSFSWGGKAVDVIKSNLSSLKVELLEPVLLKGLPNKEGYEKLKEFAQLIYEKHKEAGLVK